MTKTTLCNLSRVYRAAARLQEALAALKPADRRDASWPARIVLRLAWPAYWLTTKALVRYDVERIGTALREAAAMPTAPLREAAILTIASVGDYRADDQADEARDVAREIAAREEAS